MGPRSYALTRYYHVINIVFRSYKYKSRSFFFSSSSSRALVLITATGPRRQQRQLRWRHPRLVSTRTIRFRLLQSPPLVGFPRIVLPLVPKCYCPNHYQRRKYNPLWSGSTTTRHRPYYSDRPCPYNLSLIHI